MLGPNVRCSIELRLLIVLPEVVQRVLVLLTVPRRERRPEPESVGEGGLEGTHSRFRFRYYFLVRLGFASLVVMLPELTLRLLPLNTLALVRRPLLDGWLFFLLQGVLHLRS
jgi:hypothetical protein